MNPASALSEKVLISAFQASASDIHFYPFKDETNIYFRIQGKRVLYKSIPILQYQMLLAYYKFTSGMDIGEVRKPQHGTITHHSSNGNYNLRFSTLPVNQMESLAVRILPQEVHHTLHQLFLFPSQLHKLKRWITNRSGLILFTGPTGSGKTTTLYALLESILEEKSYQTITLEDPIEKDIKHILQVQVNEKAGVTYQTGLKAALRHDPDIIMVGEIRDKNIAKFAFEASLTGHLVLSTLHAKNAIGTIHRLLEMGLTLSELQQSLIAVAALQLLPIRYKGTSMRRAAIMELLEGELLENVLRKGEDYYINNFHSFHHLRKKAYAYGFIHEEEFGIS